MGMDEKFINQKILLGVDPFVSNRMNAICPHNSFGEKI